MAPPSQHPFVCHVGLNGLHGQYSAFGVYSRVSMCLLDIYEWRFQEQSPLQRENNKIIHTNSPRREVNTSCQATCCYNHFDDTLVISSRNEVPLFRCQTSVLIVSKTRWPSSVDDARWNATPTAIVFSRTGSRPVPVLLRSLNKSLRLSMMLGSTSSIRGKTWLFCN